MLCIITCVEPSENNTHPNYNQIPSDSSTLAHRVSQIHTRTHGASAHKRACVCAFLECMREAASAGRQEFSPCGMTPFFHHGEEEEQEEEEEERNLHPVFAGDSQKLRLALCVCVCVCVCVCHHMGPFPPHGPPGLRSSCRKHLRFHPSTVEEPSSWGLTLQKIRPWKRRCVGVQAQTSDVLQREAQSPDADV